MDRKGLGNGLPGEQNWLDLPESHYWLHSCSTPVPAVAITIGNTITTIITA